MYICDYSNNRIRKVTVLTGIISTIAGKDNYFNSQYSGDGDQATSAALNSPHGVALDAFEGFYS